MDSAKNKMVIDEILARLPVISLVRSMAVCRLWKSIITSPQTRFHSIRPTKLLVHTDRECHSLEEDRKKFETNFPLEKKVCDHAEQKGSDNGLVCISVRSPYYKTRVIIWNPCIRKHVLIPKKPFFDNSTHAIEEFGSGFGGTISGSDFKFVSLVGHSVDIYSLKRGTWQRKEMVGDTTLEITYFDRSCALLRGRLHWISPHSKRIFSFELEDEVFDQDVTMVPQLTQSHFFAVNVAVFWESSLAVIAHEVGWQRSAVWVMEKYGDVNSWNKKWNLVSSEIVHLLKSGELLLGLVRKDRESKLVTCNPKTMETRDFGRGKSSLLPGICGFTKNYKESLVLLADHYHAAPDQPTLEGRSSGSATGGACSV